MNITLNEDQIEALVKGANALKSIEINIREGIFDFYISDINEIMCLQYAIARMLNLKNDDFYEDYKISKNRETKKKSEEME